MNLAIAKSVKETVEPMFKETLPGPLSSLHFTKLDLGTVPIRMDNVSTSRTHMFLMLSMKMLCCSHFNTPFFRLLFTNKRMMRYSLILMCTGMETATFLSRQTILGPLE